MEELAEEQDIDMRPAEIEAPADRAAAYAISSQESPQKEVNVLYASSSLL